MFLVIRKIIVENRAVIISMIIPLIIEVFYLLNLFYDTLVDILDFWYVK